jgi:hypothetical protein
MFIPQRAAAPPPAPPAALEESNAVTSWVKRFFTGVDRDAPEGFQREIDRGVRSEGHKRQMLHYVDELIEKAEHAEDGAPVADAMDGALWVGIPSFVIAAATVGTAGAAAAAGLAAGAAKAGLTSRNRVSGEIRKYIQALRDVRRRIAAARVGGEHRAVEESAAVEEALLAESLGGLVKHLAVGNVEGEVKRLRAEAEDVHSPAAQAAVLRKVILMMERLTEIRHGRAGLARFVHDSAAWFQANVEGRNAVTEIDIRAGEALHALAGIRDRLLAKRWPGADATPQQADERVAGLRKAAQEALARVAAKDSYEF